MLDPFFARALKSPLDAGAEALLTRQVNANLLTWAGFGAGLLAAVLISIGWTAVAFVVLLASRLADGLDGAVARASKSTDFGAYLDIVLDLIVFTALAAGFSLADPANKFAGLALMITLAGVGTASLALQLFAAKHGVGLEGDDSAQQGPFYVSAFIEGSEVTLFFLIALVWPHTFPVIGWLFAIACGVTIAQRIFQARAAFGEDEPAN